MDFLRARQELIAQTLPQNETNNTFLGRLKQGYPPVPGQVTSLLLALRVLQDGLQQDLELNRELAHALFLVAYESRNLFESGRAAGVAWPPLLDDDLERIAIARRRERRHINPSDSDLAIRGIIVPVEFANLFNVDIRPEWRDGRCRIAT